MEYALAGLESVLPWLTNLHVHYYATVEGEHQQCALADGSEVWDQYMRKADSVEGDRFALIEFVRDGTKEQLLDDARALNAWLAAIGGCEG